MAKGREAGVTPRGISIQIFFMWRGQRCRETLKLEPTPKNILYATRLREEILRKIEMGTFDYAEYFPRSIKLKKLGLSPQTIRSKSFSNVADTWYSGLSNLSKATMDQYRRAKDIWKSELEGKAIDEVLYSDIQKSIKARGWKPKMVNNCLIPLRQIFELACIDGILHRDKNPTQFIKNAKAQKPAPDPFELHEANAIIDKFKNEQIRNYFEFAFFTGMRPEEIIALQWGDIDFNFNLARVQRTRSAGEDSEETKTHTIRDVELNSRALGALTRQKQHTFMKDDYIFHNPNSGTRWLTERWLRNTYWKPALKALGIRYRRPYNTRHTFATIALMAGANPMWVARQLGHANMNMLLTVYSKWIDAADKGRENAKIEGAISTQTGKLQAGQS